MREVRIYDAKGKLKQVLTEELLKRRSDVILKTPFKEKRLLKKRLKKLIPS